MLENKKLYQETILLAKDIIEGKYRPLLGARFLSRYLVNLHLDFDDRFTLIIGIDSECDDLLLEENEHKIWDKDLLKKMDKEADEYEKIVKSDIIKICYLLIDEINNIITKQSAE